MSHVCHGRFGELSIHTSSPGDADLVKRTGAGSATTVYRGVRIVIAIASVGIAASYGQQDESNNPFTSDPAAIAAGKVLYQETCQACHGEQAHGDRGPALATGSFEHGNEDDDIFQNIRTVLYSFALRD